MTNKSPGRLNIVNRDTFPNFQPSPIVDYHVKTKIKEVHIDMVSHEDNYKKLKELGRPIDVTNSEIYVNGNQKPDDGIFSSYFGSDTTQDRPYYSCPCQNLTGGSHLGEICPICHKKVTTVTDGDLRTTMYIDIAPYHILTYRGYVEMSKLFGEKVLLDILGNVKKIDRSGKMIDDGKLTLLDLYDNYEDDYEDQVGIERKYLFTSKIPVYSARLRPLMQYGMQMTILEPNKRYLSIVKSRNILKTAPLFHKEAGVEIQRTLRQIQEDYLEITKLVEKEVNGKSGVYRKSMASGRIDYTSRMVISLGTYLMPHEIDVPYQTMMTLYEEEIANYLSKITGMSISKAITAVEEHAMHRDDYFVNVINRLLKSKRGVWALINRNPTISESSIQYVRVRKIHDDGEDWTMHMPPDILNGMGADFRNTANHRRSPYGSNVILEIQ